MWHDIPTITGFIRQMIEIGLIKRKIMQGAIYSYPVLELADAGKKVLDEKIKIELQIIKEQKPVTVGESENATFELFSQGKSIEEIAKERNLAVSTIYTHLYKLILNNYLSSSDVVPNKVIEQIIETYNQFKIEPRLKQLKENLA